MSEIDRNLRDSTYLLIGKSKIDLREIDGDLRVEMVIKTIAKQLCLSSNHRSKTLHGLLAEKWIQGLASFPMKFMMYSPSHRQGHRKRSGLIRILFPAAEGGRVDIIEKLHIVDVDFPRRNSYDGTCEIYPSEDILVFNVK